MKRWLSLILALALLCGVFPLGAVSAEETEVVYPVEGGNIYFDPATGTVTKADKTVTEAVIPEQIQGVTVTAIGNDAFSDYSGKADALKRVVLPKTVSQIGNAAFYGRASLEEINIPAAVESIPYQCFCGCEGLKSIALPESLKEIGYWAFYGCRGITEVVLPEGLEKIESAAFEECTALSEISLPGSLNSVGGAILHGTAFFEDKSNWTDGCLYLDGWLLWTEDSVTSLHVQEGTIGISGGIGQGRALENIQLPEGLKYICNSAFMNCSKVMEIVFPESLEKLETHVFYNGSPYLGAFFKGDAPEIGENVFYVLLPDSFDYGISSSMCLFYIEGKEGWTSPTWNGYPTAVWKQIHEHEYTADVTEPTCTEDGYTVYTCACGQSYTDGKIAAFGHDYEEGKCIRCGVTSDGTCGANLTWRLDVSDGILTIFGSGKMYDYDYFDGPPWIKHKDKVLEVRFEGEISSVGKYAFKGCDALCRVTLPESLKSIELGAFLECAALEELKMPEGLEKIGESAFQESGLRAAVIPASVTQLGEFLFVDCASLVSLTIEAEVTSIGWMFCAGCTSLTEVKIPESLTEVGMQAFLKCESLEEIELPEALTTIGHSAFRECGSLSQVTFPETVKNIGATAFLECNKLTEVYFLGDAPEVGGDVFRTWDPNEGKYVNIPDLMLYYLEGKEGWTSPEWNGYPTAIWELPHEHKYTAAVTAPTCTEPGFTTYTCSCGDSYTADQVAALGHDYEEGKCARCSEADPDYKPVIPPVEFEDVSETAWYKDAVDYAISNGLMNGMGDGKFEPESPMTRAMLVTVLWRYAGSPEEGTNEFSDVKDGQWYTKAVAWAAKNGVVTGVGNGRFDPEGKITREQMATILYRYSNALGLDTSKGETLSSFPDGGKVSAYAADALSWAVAEGLIAGTAQGGKVYLDPQGSATRAQVATILMRYIENVAT